MLLDDIYRMRPIKDNPLWYDRATWLDEIFRHESRDDSNWRLVNPSTHYGALDLPAVHVGGWYDVHLEGTLRNYMGMRRQASTERARSAQRLIIARGPTGLRSCRSWATWTSARRRFSTPRLCGCSGSATGCRRLMGPDWRRCGSS